MSATFEPRASRRRPAGDGRVRVLHVITHLGHGGATDNTLLTVAGLDRSRYEVDLVAGPGSCQGRAKVAADRLFVLPYLRRPVISPGDLLAAFRLWRMAGDYDVVHTHTSKAGVLGRLAARAAGVPAIVHTIHGFPVHDYMPNAQRRLLLAIERLASRCADRIVCVCDANAVEALELKIAQPEQLRTVVSGVPVDQVKSGDGARARAALGIPAEAPVAGTVTRLMEQKAPLDFVAAAQRVTRAMPDAHVLLIGDGELRSEVEAAIDGNPRIRLLGFRDDIPDLLQAMDVVAFSSLWEGLGRALTEAVLVGRPVVATAVNGVPDLVDQGVTGFLTPAGAPEVLADRILEVLALPDRGRAMGARGAARIAGSFDISKMVEGLDETYQEVLAGRRPAVGAGAQ